MAVRACDSLCATEAARFACSADGPACFCDTQQPASESMQFFPFQEIRAKELKYVQEAKKKENDSCILWSQAVRRATSLRGASVRG